MSLGGVRCTRRTEALPCVVVELRGGAAASLMQAFGESAQPLQAITVGLFSQVLEESEGTTAGAVNVALYTLDVVLVTVADRVNECIARTADGAFTCAQQPIVFRQCP